ncbi:hypothetical protein HQ496_14020 [bacterium]|nr:hypothetical protein [bacterium]
MRYGLFILFFAVFGLGEYAFVEYYPLSHQRRVQKFEQLPIVKQIVIHQEKEIIRQAFAAEEDGILSYKVGKTTHTWTSFADWQRDRKKGVWAAHWLTSQIQMSQGAKIYLPEILERAENGDPYAAIQMGWISRSLNDATLNEKALSLLKTHQTAVGQYFYYLLTKNPGPSISRQPSALLYSRMALENWRWPGSSDEEFAQQSAKHAKSIATLKENAALGIEDAIQIVEQLRSEGLMD